MLHIWNQYYCACDNTRETEAQLTDRLQKEKRSREEEARQMQERAAGMIQELEKELEKMRGSTLAKYYSIIFTIIPCPNRRRRAP